MIMQILKDGDIRANKIFGHSFYTTENGGDPIKVVDYTDTTDGGTQMNILSETMFFSSSDSKICFGSNENCFGLEDLNILKGKSYFNIKSKDSDDQNAEEILRCTGKNANLTQYRC